MIASPEVKTLEAALQALKQPPDPTHLPALSRAVARAADDLELVAEETADRAVRKALLAEVVQAKKAVTVARKRAHQAALTVDRAKLFEAPQEVTKEEKESDAAQLAHQINDSLRRTTAMVSEEIDRSRAAGNVVDESTRRLRMTRDQHGSYGESLSSGAYTLKGIQKTEMLANVLIIMSFVIFFLAAAYVTKRRIANSNISTFVVRPGMAAASIPVRIIGWMVRTFGGVGRRSETTEEGERKGSSSAKQADEAMKAKEGRENLKAAKDMAVSQSNMAVSDENETCGTEQECRSAEAHDSKKPNQKSADVAGKGDD